MKLLHSLASPFSRKVLVTAHELGITADIELVPLATSPLKAHPMLVAGNPLAKIPTLLLHDGSALYDSRVIIEYLLTLGSVQLMAPAGPHRWRGLRWQALADGVMDASVAIRYETTIRPADKIFPDWIQGQRNKIAAALDALETEPLQSAVQPLVGQIAIACALGYLDYRVIEPEWRTSRPLLAAFFAAFSGRRSMTATMPAAL
ncbi:MAG TPA: glutathione S-transferase family protein [Steroidobacteraceae bacterium]